MTGETMDAMTDETGINGMTEGGTRTELETTLLGIMTATVNPTGTGPEIPNHAAKGVQKETILQYLQIPNPFQNPAVPLPQMVRKARKAKTWTLWEEKKLT